MKLILLLLSVSSLSASSIKFAWNASTSEGITNYMLHVTQGTNEATINVGTNLTATAEGLTPGIWTFAASCQISPGIVSDRTPPLVVEVPQPPTLMRTIVVQYSGTLSNFADVGFFRLRIP